jgi:small subunit ribosomal protein S1
MSSDSPTEHQTPHASQSQEKPETAEAAEQPSIPENAPAAPPPSEADTPTGAAPPAQDAPAPAQSAAGEQTGAPASAEEPAPKRRVRLNPTGAAELKAVPNVGGPAPAMTPTAPAPPPPAETAASDTPEPELSQPAAAQEPPPSAPPRDRPAPAAPAQPVEIPDSSDLDAALEAEIEAAMQGDEEAAAVQAPVARVEGAPDEQAPATPVSEEDLEEGARLAGAVQSVSGENVFVDLGFRAPAVVQTRQFPEGKVPQIGETLKVIFDRYDPEEGLIFARLAGGVQKVSGNWDAVEAGQIVDCMVTKTNKGGLEVRVSNLRGFMPAGQVDLRYVDNLEPFVGKKLRAKILEADPRKRNLILSRRALLEEEREALAADVWQTLEVGQERRGTVKTLKNYGAFVDIGGLDGFLHIGEISWQRLNHPSEVLSEGQQVDVKILSIDKEKNRIGLGMRQLSKSPWEAVAENFAVGSIVAGKVTRTTDFGAFVELEPGVEGLVHISELEYRRVNKVTEVVNVGDEVEVKVLEVDPDKKRISLSIKQTQERPASTRKSREPKTEDEDLAPSGGRPYTRKRSENLKGGTGSSSGGLFGNPADYD